MNKIIRNILIIASLLFVNEASLGSHVAGGDINYVCLGNNQFQITLNLFRDCSGIAAPTSTQINFSNSCGLTNPTPLTLTLQNPGGTEISQLCAAQQGNSRCNPGGTLPGMQVYTYQAVVTLPDTCNFWTFSYSLNARNTSTNVPGSSSVNLYIAATLNNATAPCNNSPIFTSQPIPYVCAGQVVNYNYGVVESQGDSLAYSLVSGRSAATTNLLYGGGYSATSPIPGITVNPVTGQLNFTAPGAGIFIVVVLVEEYRNGVLIGTVYRDIQFIVQNCSNNIPDANAGTINIISGTAVQTGPYSLEMCEGQSFCFTAQFVDIDTADILSSFSNAGLVLPGSSVSTTGTNPLTATVCWTAPPNSSSFNTDFTMMVFDDACPVTGLQSFVYNVFVSPSTTAGPDQIICGSQSAQLTAAGGSAFTWTVLAGDPISVPGNFSCDTCASPVATPSITTTYLVTSNLSSTCFNTDTVEINVVPGYVLNVTQSTNTSCLNDSVQLIASPGIPGTYTYQWSPATNLDFTNIPNPIASFSLPGTYVYNVSVTDQNGCIQTGSVTINVVPSFPPAIEAVTADPVFCRGNDTQLNVNFTSTFPPFCFTTTSICSGPTTNTVIGANTTMNTTTAYPAPYGNFFESTRQQYMFTAAELVAAGITGGRFSSISFDIANLVGLTDYENYTIRMGCTNQTHFNSPNTFVSGLQTVFGPATVTIQSGLNTHVFTNRFDWDGTSNIVIEICDDNQAVGFSNNSQTKYTQTPFTSCIFYRLDGGFACPGTTVSGRSANRPNITFETCGISGNPNTFSYQWSPPNMVTDDTLQDPFTLTSVTTTYTVTVIDLTSGCTSVSSVVANVSFPTPDAGNDVSICTGDSTLLSATGGGLNGVYSWSPPLGLADPNSDLTMAGPAGTTTYTVTVTDDAGCTDTDEVIVTVNPTPTADFTGLLPLYCFFDPGSVLNGIPPGGVFTGPGMTGSTFEPFNAGAGPQVITYTYTDPITLCSKDTSMSTVVLPPMVVTLSGLNPEYCRESTPSTLTGNPAGGTFSGPGVSGNTFNPNITPGTHTIQYTYIDPAGCPQVARQDVVVHPPPSLAIAGLNSGYCINSPNVNLVSNPTGGVFTVNGNASTVFSPAGLGLGTHIVNVTYTDPLTTCVNDITNNVSVNALPAISAGSDLFICNGAMSMLNASGGATYVWSPSAGLTDVNIANPIASPNVTQTYTVIGTDANNCSNSDDVVVNVVPIPVAQGTASVLVGFAPLDVTFTNSSTNATIYNWDFGVTGATSTLANPTYTFTQGGVFTVVLTAFDNSQNCYDTTRFTIVVNSEVAILPPNVFTPNGSGPEENNVFRIDTRGLSDIEVIIYNRWGLLIGEWIGLSGGWDGRTKSGNLADDGVYYFVVNATGLDGLTYNKRGFFHIVSGTSN